MIAYILAGGKGSRLAPWHAPKSLLPIRGVSILQRILTHLHESRRVSHIVICTGYRHEDIVASVRAHGWQEGYVSFSKQAEDAAMGERLWYAHMQYMDDRGLVVYADELANVDLDALTIVHQSREGREMTFTATYTNVPGGTVEETASGPKVREGVQTLMNIGYVMVEPLAWSHLSAGMGVSDWINQVRERVGDVGLFYHQGKRATVNSLADLTYAEEVWR